MPDACQSCQDTLYAVRVPYLHPPGGSFEALRGGREYCSFPEVKEACHWQSSSEEEGVPRCPCKKPLVSEHNHFVIDPLIEIGIMQVQPNTATYNILSLAPPGADQGGVFYAAEAAAAQL
jgi:hypothetical protein